MMHFGIYDFIYFSNCYYLRMKGVVELKRKDYPENLLSCPVELPEKLYVSGKILKKDKRAVAIVGSRRMSEYGRNIAIQFAREFGKNGVTVISGGARGIDSTAHLACLEAGGRTIAVLGCGVDVVYPPENGILFKKIAKKGALLSEFEPGTKPLPQNFLQRNRLIAAMSKIVLVVEGARRSGTLSIANHAANLGVDVFAIPGRIDNPMSALPNYLIESGAGVARRPQDLLEVIK